MSQQKRAILEGSRILVTGANGYIGANIIDILLDLGYNVRGTVRAEKPWLNNFFETKYGKGRFETVILSNMETEGVFDSVLEDIAGVLHTASDVSMNPDPNSVIPQMIAVTVNILKAASEFTTVKRLVLTSSSTAAFISKQNDPSVVTQDTWNDCAIQAAWNERTTTEQKPFLVYAASKTEAERAAWAWVRENKPSYVLNTVLPSINYGPSVSPHSSASTMGQARKLLQGDDTAMRRLLPQWYVDVRDTARLHVIALLESTVMEERIFAFASPHNLTDVICILRKLRPWSQLPNPPEDDGRDLSDVKPSGRAEQLLRDFFGQPSWTTLEESLADGIIGFE